MKDLVKILREVYPEILHSVQNDRRAQNDKNLLMLNLLLIIFGKLLSFAIQTFNLGNGSTWPGHIALMVNKNFIQEMIRPSNLKIIIIAGTNGKTTTSSMLRLIFEKSGRRVFQNASGANLLNGIASSIVLHSSILSTLNYDYAIFEADENALPLIIKEITPDYLLLLNLFRDQLDRYGEVNIIAQKWKEALKKLPEKTILICNADDPQIAFLGKNRTNKNFYFGLDTKQKEKARCEHAADTTYCPNCGEKLAFRSITFSHLGDWHCSSCGLRRPSPDLPNFPYHPLSGTYNKYNTLAATLLAKIIGLKEDEVVAALQSFKPAFGRQEKLMINGKQIQIFLSKNPTGFNESLRTIKDLHAKTVLLLLNDGIADGRDVSWIWDVDFEDFVGEFEHIIISGNRAYDMGLRAKYALEGQKSKVPTSLASGDLRGVSKSQNYPPILKSSGLKDNSKLKIYENLGKAIEVSLRATQKDDTLYILPTYTAMLEVRKNLTGRKIL